MFGNGIKSKIGMGAPQGAPMPAQAPAAPQGNPLDEVNAKLDQILMLLQKDAVQDQAEGQQQGGVQNA